MEVYILVCVTGKYDSASERNLKVFSSLEDAEAEMKRLQAIVDPLNEEWEALIDLHNYPWKHDNWKIYDEQQEALREKYVEGLKDEYMRYACIDGSVIYSIDTVPFHYRGLYD